MSKNRTCMVMAIVLGLVLLAASPQARAQGTQIKPYLLFIFDTSGSMVRTTLTGAATYGDGTYDYWTGGSTNCCRGLDNDGNGRYDDSRMFISKEAIRKMVAASGDITFGLMKFPQIFDPSSGQNGVLYQNNQGSGYDYICYSGWTTGASPPTSTSHYYCSSSNINEFLAVPLGLESSNQVYEWVNHTEYVGGVHVEHELRGNGTTPLAWTIGQAGDYFEGSGYFGSTRVLPVDPYRGCRPYYTIVLADGDNTSECGGNPVTEVGNMWSLQPGVDPACTTHADCPGDYPTSPWGGRCVAGQCTYQVYTYVIGMAYSSSTLNQMADIGDNGAIDGSTPTAFRADTEAQLSVILADIVADSVLVEVCDGEDNDCDTLVDEGVLNACGGCGPVPPEVCNDGTDDDCDTLIDEGFTLYCDVHDVLGLGATSVRERCSDPGETVCDGVDDNCNGATDEGVCGGCIVSPEVCNNADDDCDTIIDNGLTRACGTDVGECVSGTQTCSLGVWGSCSGVGPGTETCNGLDDDCNGVVDGMTEACEMSPGVADTGECEYGYHICLSGSWTTCVGGVGPTGEVCNGLDDDCDGTADDGDPGGGAPCGTDTGECDDGTVHCIGGVLVCTGGITPVPEVCNCLDDDCDGTADEGNPGGGASCGPVTLDGIGICEAGVETCSTSCSIICIGAVYPGTEDCNGLDDDCNTLVDDGVPTGDACGTDEGECTSGLRQCIMGAWVCVGEVGPTPEICDGLDNDCDASIDEGNPGGGLPCGTDVGICEPGVTMCDTTLVPPAIICYGEIGPETEVCNGLDDDCNGLVDDGLSLGDPCGTDEGECEEGVYICNERGELECAFGRGPSPEICDCLDNDCDALVDEENPCPEGVCVDCSCAGPCNPTEEWPCPSGRVCMAVDGEDGYWCVGDPCEDVECTGCDRCLYGECVSPCEGVVCPDGQVCSVGTDCVGRCVPADCYAPGFECEEGERCVGGECEADPCWEVDCGPGRFCREGDCFDVCGADLECPEGTVCHDGECVADPCFEVVCTGGRICVDGECVDDPCEGIFCPPPRICVDGTCVDDPCSYIDCPEGYVCVGDTCVDETTIVTDDPPDGPPDADTDGGTAGQDILATGAGGCAGCTIGARHQGGGLAGLAALIALAAALGLGRRKRS